MKEIRKENDKINKSLRTSHIKRPTPMSEERPAFKQIASVSPTPAFHNQTSPKSIKDAQDRKWNKPNQINPVTDYDLQDSSRVVELAKDNVLLNQSSDGHLTPEGGTVENKG